MTATTPNYFATKRADAAAAWTAAGGALRHVKTIVGYSAKARFHAQLDEDIVGFIPRTIDTPYAYSPTHAVYGWNGQLVIIAETKHRRYDVFAVSGPISKTDD